jgi:hypothetical protein
VQRAVQGQRSSYANINASNVVASVADPGCLSRIPDPDFYPSRIPDQKTVTKERGENIFCQTFFAAINFTKL